MNAVATGQSGAIRFDLTLPVTRIGVGPFSFDPVERLIGAPLAEIVESMLVGPVRRRPSASGPAVDVYPLAMPEGEGASIPLGAWGEVGFHNEGGLLVLTLPVPMRNWIVGRLGGNVVSVQEGLSADESSRVAKVRVRIRDGMRVVVPAGTIGELAIEARS